MHIAIIGAAGMIGRKLTEAFLRDPKVGSADITKLTLVDIIDPAASGTFEGEISIQKANIADPNGARSIAALRPDVFIHLAAIVSAEAEMMFEKGYDINLSGTRNLFEAIRSEAAECEYVPRVVFSSSLAVFGAPLPDLIDDEFILSPLTSYGTQKAIGELLLDDYSRHGFFDGVGIRLPTICIRPGLPNKAASGFFSSILREPLVGREAVLPVSDEVRHWHASPRSAVKFIRHAAALDTSRLGARRTMTMPGVSATVSEQIEALRRIAGDKAVNLIRREPNELVQKIISGWPRGFDTKRATELGFVADRDFDEIIRAHVQDELGGELTVRGQTES